MKTILLFFCFVLGIVNGQNKHQNSGYIQKNIESCRIKINDSLSVYKINEILYNNNIDIVIKTENEITDKCINPTIGNALITKLKTSQNVLIKVNKHYVEDFDVTDFKNLIPNKIYAIKKANYNIVIIELYNFSYSTVGSSYVDLCLKVDLKGIVVAKKIIESKSLAKINKCKIFFKES